MSSHLEERLRTLYHDLTSEVPGEGPGLGVGRVSDLAPVRDMEPRPSRWPWILSTAAALVLVVGLIIVTRSQPSDSTPVGPAVTEGPLPDTVAPSDPPSTTLPPELRFPEPLGAGMIATLDPAPSDAAVAYDLGQGIDDWAYGRDAVTTVWIVVDGEWFGSLSVFDQGLPWDIAVDGLAPTPINGVDAVIDRNQSAVALRLDNGGTRVIQSSNDGPARPELLDAAAELAGVVGTSPIDSVLPTDRFVVPIAITRQGPLLRYGDPESDETSEVVVYQLERTPSTDELRWMSSSLRWLSAKLPADEPDQINANAFETTLNGGQRSLVELISPLDVVAVLAPPDTDMTAVSDSLVFETIEQSGLTVEENLPTTPNVIARGEHAWGRWQVATSTDQPCRSITYALWSQGQFLPIGTGGSTCDPDRSFAPAICASAGPGRMLVVALGVDAEAVAVEVNGAPVSQTIENGDGGVAVLIDDVPTGPTPISVYINGTEVDCTPT